MTNIQLKKLMNSKGLTIPYLAKLLHVSIGCVRKWRTGERPISAAMERYIRMSIDKTQLDLAK